MHARASLWVKAGLALLAALAACVTLYLNNPTECVWMPKCPFHLLTDLRCPGCGTLRGAYSLMHLDPVAAWRYNPGMPVLLGICAGIFISYRRCGGHSRACRMWIYAYIAAFMLWWVVRNLAGI